MKSIDELVPSVNAELGRTPEHLSDLLARLEKRYSLPAPMGIVDQIDTVDSIFFTKLGVPFQELHVERTTFDRMKRSYFTGSGNYIGHPEIESGVYFRGKIARPIDGVPVGTVRLMHYDGEHCEERVMDLSTLGG